jgi:hypothetical protein
MAREQSLSSPPWLPSPTIEDVRREWLEFGGKENDFREDALEEAAEYLNMALSTLSTVASIITDHASRNGDAELLKRGEILRKIFLVSGTASEFLVAHVRRTPSESSAS